MKTEMKMVWIVQSFGSEGNTYEKAFSSEENAIKHYDEIVSTTFNEFTLDFGEDFSINDYKEIDDIYRISFDSEKYSECIEIVGLPIN